MHLADPSVPDQLARPANNTKRARVRPDLKDRPVLPNGIAHRAALANCKGKGLFAIDVFAGLGSLNHGNGVPMVRRGDKHCVNIFSGKN